MAMKYKFRWILNQILTILITENKLENIDCKISAILSQSICQSCRQSDGRELMETGNTWWRHQMETFSALLPFFAGNSPVAGEFPSQRPMMRSFDVFLYLCLNKQLSIQDAGDMRHHLSHYDVTVMNNEHMIRPEYCYVFILIYEGQIWICQLNSTYICWSYVSLCAK